MRGKRRRLLGGAAVSLVVHVAILVALVRVTPIAPRWVDPPVTQIELVEIPPPPPPTPPAPAPKPAPTPAPTPAPVHAEAKPAPAKSAPPRMAVRAPRTPPDTHAMDELVAAKTQGSGTGAGGNDELSEAQAAGAATAESGGGGGDCNMAARLQAALRKDRLVQAAVSQAYGTGKAVLVWNGDWVQSRGEDGKGLSAVREAIMWEIAFAPPACRSQAVHGLVVVSLNAGPGSSRLAVGSGAWRWSDLLRPTQTIVER